MTKGKHHDRDVWGPPTPKDDAAVADAPPPLSKFQKHFQDRMSHLGKDDANVLAGAAPTTTTSAVVKPATRESLARKPVVPKTGATSGATKQKAKPQRNAFVTPDQVRSQQRAELVQRQQQQQQGRQPPAGAAPTRALPLATSAAPDNAVKYESPNSTAADAAKLSAAAPVTAQTVEDFLEQLRQQAESMTTTVNAPVSPVKAPVSQPSASPLASQPPLKRRPNSGQRLAPLAPTPDAPPTKSVASARRDTGSSDTTGVAVKNAKRVSDQAQRSPSTTTKNRWAAPATKDKNAKANKPVIDSRAAPTRQVGSSDVLRLATPKPVPVEGDGTSSSPAHNTDAPAKRRVSYTPYSMGDYHSMMDKVANEKRGGLGPSDTDAQRLARERLERQRAYGKKATQHALEVLKAADVGEEEDHDDADGNRDDDNDDDGNLHKNSVAAPSDGDDDATVDPPAPRDQLSSPRVSDTSSSAAAAAKKRKRKMLRQPTPEKVVQARERRQRALDYARDKAAEATEEQRANDAAAQAHATSIDTECGGKQKRVPPADKAAIEREQRRLDLEAKHEQQKMAVEHIRKQLRT